MLDTLAVRPGAARVGLRAGHDEVVGVLDPDHREILVACSLDQSRDPRDHHVPVVGVCDDAALDADDDQGAVCASGKLLMRRVSPYLVIPLPGARQVTVALAVGCLRPVMRRLGEVTGAVAPPGWFRGEPV